VTSTNLQIPAIVLLFVCALLPTNTRAADDGSAAVETTVAQAIRPLMERYNVPGMAAGIVTTNWNHVYNYGVASKETGKPLTSNTLFEIGSVSKTFTATLAAYAQGSGQLSLSDSASKYLSSLAGSSFDRVSLLNLGTHTSGGLPLQFSGGILNDDQLMQYFRNWKPNHPPGTTRLYSNTGVGMLGMITARSMNVDFTALVEDKLFSALGMKNTYFDVPNSQVGNYAQGYTKTDVPIRLAPGILAAEAYGVRATAGDMVRFVQANMRMLDINEKLQHAITDTHTGYYRIGAMTQDLIWEQYPDPVDLKDLLDGNSARMSDGDNPAAALDPPSQPRDDVVIDKTGSTNGFSACVAFIPGKKIGVVLLANKNCPIDARVIAVHAILTRLEEDAAKN
jgi:beta-lactamase class C